MKVAPPLALVGMHEIEEGVDVQVIAKYDGILQDKLAAIAMKTARSGEEGEERLSICEGSDYEMDIVREYSYGPGAGCHATKAG